MARNSLRWRKGWRWWRQNARLRQRHLHETMTTWFISRHSGAIEWAARQNMPVDHFVAHLDIGQIRAGDKVIGSLPVNLVAQVCTVGANYWHLSLRLPADLRGRELSAQDMEQLNSELVPFHVMQIEKRK